jgi:hypothetical protein
MRKFGKILFLTIVLLGSTSFFTSCNVKKEPILDQKEMIYNLAVESGYTGTYEQWLSSIKGDSIELIVNETHIMWKYKEESSWKNLIELSKLSGNPGKDGVDGVNGKTPEFRVNEGYLEWKYEEDTEWVQLYKAEIMDKKEITVKFVTEYNGLFADNSGIVEFVEAKMEEGAIKLPKEINVNDYNNWYYYDKYSQKFEIWKFDYYYAQTDMVLYGEQAETIKKLNLLDCEFFADDNCINIDQNNSLILSKSYGFGTEYAYCYADLNTNVLEQYTKLVITVTGPVYEEIIIKINDNILVEKKIICNGNAQTYTIDFSSISINHDKKALLLFPGSGTTNSSGDFIISQLYLTN